MVILNKKLLQLFELNKTYLRGVVNIVCTFGIPYLNAIYSMVDRGFLRRLKPRYAWIVDITEFPVNKET